MNIQEVLRKHKKKVTPERVELFLWMEKKHLFNSWDLESSFSHIGRASIFRTIKLFVEIWVLRRVSLWEQAESYEIECCEDHHHEHMKCQSCWNVYSFNANIICKLLWQVAKKHGFQMQEHSVSLFWRCKNCNS